MSSPITPIPTMSGVISGGDKLQANLTGMGSLTGRIEGELRQKSYNDLIDKPRINDVPLQGNKTLAELNFNEITPQEIDNIIFGGD